MILAGLVFLLTTDPVWITLAAIIGIVSPSGGEIGPFLSIEQAALSQLIPDHRRTRLFRLVQPRRLLRHSDRCPCRWLAGAIAAGNRLE